MPDSSRSCWCAGHRDGGGHASDRRPPAELGNGLRVRI